MNFKLWLEVIELKKPTSKVRRSNTIKDKGTNVAREIIQYIWKTTYGNEINLQLEPKGNDVYSVIFYVNNVLYDYGSKLGLADKNVTRDSEILANVFYVLKQKANKLNAKILTFRAQKSENDTKIIRNIDIEPHKKVVLQLLSDFVRQITSHEVKEVSPSQTKINLYAKLGRGMPKEYDLDKDRWLRWANVVKDSIDNNIQLDDLINNLKTAVGLGFPYQVGTLISNLVELNKAILSNTDRGYARTRNRRANVYKRVLDRYFSDEWVIHVDGDNFTLMRL